MVAREYTQDGQIQELLHYINSIVMKDWRLNTPAFNEAISIRTLTQKCCMSERNMQLKFKAEIGEPIGQYIQRLRLEKALLMLKENRLSNREISEYIGFDNPPALNNLLRKKLNQTPQQLKYELLSYKSKPYPYSIEPCRIEKIKSKWVLSLSYLEDYEIFNHCLSNEEDKWEELYNFAQKNHHLPNIEEYWGIAYDDSNITKEGKCRFATCLTVQPNPAYKAKVTDKIKLTQLPDGLYAIYTHRGSYDLLDSFYDAILQQIPKGFHLKETPILERYLNTAINQDDLITEVWLPL